MGTAVGVACCSTRLRMLPWLGPWGTDQEEATEEPGLSTGSDHGEAWSSGEETMEEPGTPVQDSPQPQALSPSEIGRTQLPPPSQRATEQTPETAVPLSPQATSQVTPSTMTPLPFWDPSHQANARPQPVGASCGPGVSFSTRTLCHPSWPMYDLWGRIPAPGHPEEEGLPRVAGLPVRSYEDVFLLDPLLPCGQRVPLYLSKPPQQATGSLKLLLPPPIMSPSVHPSSSQACSSTWLSEAEMIALTGLLQMSQGELRPNSLVSPLTPASCLDPVSVSEDPGSSGSQSCSGSTDPCPTQTPDTHCPK